jgi:ATP/ADP translocase
MSELWGSVVISLLFWSLADDVCNVSEAKVRACAPHPSRRLPCTGL